jgi:hypothetical protein
MYLRRRLRQHTSWWRQLVDAVQHEGGAQSEAATKCERLHVDVWQITGLEAVCATKVT